jgi:glyoxylase-like metal-dependent hydrolase (beta-lactamase superfamily II)
VTADPHLSNASDQIHKADRAPNLRLVVQAYFDEPTFTASYLIHDPVTRKAAIIDSVCNFDQPSGRTSFASADAMIGDAKAQGLSVDWILETHAHADHLSAAPYLQEKLGGQIAIGAQITKVQSVFANVFNEDASFARDGSQFDHLFSDGDVFSIGAIPAIALHVPGHTPADMAYIIGDAAFVGDTMFMPDYGSARADFPGGDARQLFRSIRRLMELPSETRVFLCHDYKTPKRKDFIWETTIGAQRADNIHVHDGVLEDDFVAMRTKRDATLGMPRLILPSIQVNIRAGHLPNCESNGTRYLKLPLNALKG